MRMAKRAVDNVDVNSRVGFERSGGKGAEDKIMTNLSSGPYELVRMFRMLIWTAMVKLIF